jgi:catechol 2,3-dioxygenase-like lactoylglutathione lyase family enzyme
VRRLHVALAVDDLEATIRDYSVKLGADPIVVVAGAYALWRTAEVNLSVNCDPSLTERLRHLGFEDDATASKSIATDVNGLVWESFSAAQQDEEIVRAYGEASELPPTTEDEQRPGR